MKEVNPVYDNRPKWNVHSKIEKYHTDASWKKGVPDEVVDMAANCLLNNGVNLLWGLVAGFWSTDQNTALATAGSKNLLDGIPPATGQAHPLPHFDSQNSFIVVGDNINHAAGETTDSYVPTEKDTMLHADQNYLFMFMSPGEDFDYSSVSDPAAVERLYPKYGTNKKIVFRAEFPPGTACFEWKEWGIANGNGNNNTNTSLESVIMTVPGSDGSPAPENPLQAGIHYPAPVSGTEVPPGVIFLNHKQDNMGKKYSSATWVVSIEISLS